MRTKIFTFVFLGVVATSAFAAEWTFVATDSQYLSFNAYERNSGKKSPDGFLLVWTAEINSNPKTPYDLLLELNKFDCFDGRFKIEQFATYLRGRLKYQAEGNKKWEYAIPGTIGESKLRQICYRFYGPETSDISTGYVYNGNDLGELVLWGKDLLKKFKTSAESSL